MLGALNWLSNSYKNLSGNYVHLLLFRWDIEAQRIYLSCSNAREVVLRQRWDSNLGLSDSKAIIFPLWLQDGITQEANEVINSYFNFPLK